jgi:acyl-CoA thioesterase-1
MELYAMRKYGRIFVYFMLIFFLQACDSPQSKLYPVPSNAVILAFGDSLTYGTGVSTEKAYPAVLQKMTGITVVNAGIPGEETRDSRNRIELELKKSHPNLVIVCLGGNDLIRRRDKASVKENLAAIIQTIKNSGAQVVLIAVPDFKLSLTVPELGLELGVPVENNVIADLESRREIKSDDIHFNAEGYKLLAQDILLFLKARGAL